MYLTSVIDDHLWNNAEWRGTVFGYHERLTCPLFVGPLFGNEEAGRAIFERWRRHLGDADVHELIKVSTIEGDIEGEASGYSVYIGTDPEAAFSLASARGDGSESPRFVAMTGRVNRMTPPEGSAHLPDFKQNFEREHRFLLLPCFLHGEQLTPAFELAIEKTKVSFLQVEDLSENDVEAVVLQRGDKRVAAEVANTPMPDWHGPHSLSTALAVLEVELGAGTVSRPIDPMLAESLVDIQYNSEGEVIPESVNPMLAALAAIVLDDVVERQALTVPLLDLQAEYVSFLEHHFAQPYGEMTKHNVSPHLVAENMAADADLVSDIAESAPEMLAALTDFWKKAGFVILTHLRAGSTLRAVYGGTSFLTRPPI